MRPSSYTGAAGHEDYSYFSDGKLQQLKDYNDTDGPTPPTTVRKLGRSYSYDNVGRVINGAGFTGGCLPYCQRYDYDAFGNMTLRTGSFYNNGNQFPSTDNATYVNNRRNGWSYNADGQVVNTPTTTTDLPRSIKYDGAGRMVSTMQSGQSNTVTYSASYDGDGHMVFESSVTSPGSSVSSYIVRSTVLGGEPLTRLDQSGNKKITHVPAEGLLFATQRSDTTGESVLLTQRNPLGITETFQAVYDPLGNYIPFQKASDPRPPVGSFTSGSMAGLSSSQADPNGYAVGCIMDGLPTSCTKVMNAINRGQAKEVRIFGTQNPNVVLMNQGFIIETHKQTVRVDRAPDPNIFDPDHLRPRYDLKTIEVIDYVMIPGAQTDSTQNPPQDPTKPDTRKEFDVLKLMKEAQDRRARKELNSRAWKEFSDCFSENPTVQKARAQYNLDSFTTYIQSTNIDAIVLSTVTDSLPSVLRNKPIPTPDITWTATKVIFGALVGGISKSQWDKLNQQFETKVKPIQDDCSKQIEKKYGFLPTLPVR
jgi:hypothetical protein